MRVRHLLLLCSFYFLSVAVQANELKQCSYRFADVDQEPDGDYSGQCLYGKAHGKGKVVYDDGNIRTGIFKNGIAHGIGSFTSQNGKYQGNYFNGLRSGYGEYSYGNGDKYKGNWVRGVKQGEGTLMFASGEKYVGSWKDNQRNGYGTYNYARGDTYEGDWKNDSRHGKGFMQYYNGTTYKGGWQFNRMNGQGVYVHFESGRYEGSFQGGDFHGHGTYFYTDGSKYEGLWRFDNKHGKGVLTFADGTKIHGQWVDGKRVSKDPQKTVAKNKTLKNKNAPSSNLCETELSELDNVSGVYIIKDTRQLYSGCILIRESGGSIQRQKVVAGFKASAIYYSPDNKIIKEENFNVRGELHGLLISFYPDGKKKSQEEYLNGLLDGAKTNWYENGNKVSEQNYTKGQLHGKETVWYYGGGKKIEAHYENGKKLDYTKWKDKGKFKEKVTWNNSRVIKEKTLKRVNGAKGEVNVKVIYDLNGNILQQWSKDSVGNKVTLKGNMGEDVTYHFEN